MLTKKHTDLLSQYQSGISSYDEVLDSEGRVKPHWNSLFEILEKIGVNELATRGEEIARKLRENGVTYNVYDSSGGLNRQWLLDPIPFLITQTEWNDIEKGLIQRATVLDLMLKDLYGPRNLVKDRIIPPELVYGNTGFFRQCCDIKFKSKQQLLIYAADMARGPDGRMWVLDNRTQAPSGSGYALENRSVLSRILPELAQEMYVNRLSPYFFNLQKSIFKLSANQKDEPYVVYLTPGPHNETYFEHSYLASYLGCALVQGDDLLVRDGFVWLKSIEGLQRVDIIIRRVDDEFIDPLEFRVDSKLGIPGLLQVIRNGNVSVINPPGTSLVENNALMAFINNASKYLIGQDLILPSVATWWCGQAKELDFVLNNLEKLIIKKANRKQKYRSVFGRLLSINEREELKLKIRQSPHEFVAQEEVSLSTVPSFTGAGIEPRFAALRSFLVSDGDGYYVMKGGLTRSSAEKDKFVISGQYGGVSKDTWIVSDKPEDNQDKVVVNNDLLQKRNTVLPSRSAENLYWTGRYAERSLIVSRVINNLINSLNVQHNFGGLPKEDHIEVLLKSLTHLTLTYPGFLEEKNCIDKKTRYKELSGLINQIARSGSVVFNVDCFLRAVISVRERWTIGTWRIIDLIENVQTKLKAQKGNIADEQKLLEKLNTRLFTFYGIVNETMTRDNGMLLFEAGKLVERSLALVSQIRSCACFKYDEGVEHEILESVLYNNHSLISYRSKYKSQVKIESFLDMIIFESKLPHSLVNLLDRLSECLNSLPQNSLSNRLNDAQKAILEAVALTKLADVSELSAHDHKSREREALENLLAKVCDNIIEVSASISIMYFSHAKSMNSLSGNSDENPLNEI